LVVPIYDVWCVPYSVAVIVCAVVVAPVVAFFVVIPKVRVWNVTYEDVLNVIYEIVVIEDIVLNLTVREFVVET
jgi:hypothetical protein